MINRYWSRVSRLPLWASNIFFDLVTKLTGKDIVLVEHDGVAIRVPSDSPTVLEHHLLGVSSENVHEEVDFGDSVGNEF